MRWTVVVMGVVGLVVVGLGLGWLADRKQAPAEPVRASRWTPVEPEFAVEPRPIPVTTAKGARCRDDLLAEAPGSARAAIDAGSLVLDARGVGFEKGLSVAPRDVVRRTVELDFGDGGRGTWNVEAGTSTGFRFAAVPDDSLAAALGFQLHDVLAEVDGQVLVDRQGGMSLWEARQDAPAVCVRYVRDGRFLVRYIVAADAIPPSGQADVTP